MNNKTKMIAVSVVLLVAGFLGGMFYGQSKTPTNQQGLRGANFQMNQNGARGTARGGAGGGFTSGEILSKDTNGVTIKMQNGSTKIVLLSASTPVMKTVSGSLNDLVIGEQISANGTANADGSISAQTIQIRPATTTRPFGQ